MTDTKDLIREIQEHTAAHGDENTATHLLVQAVMALQRQADEMAAIGAGGVSGPLLGGAALAAPQQAASAVLRQSLLDPENQPNQYGVEFGMSGPQMHFKIDNQLFKLAYEPDDEEEFEFMKRMLINAFSVFTPDVKAAPQQVAPAVTDDLRDRLVAISEAIADQDDRGAQAMIREILKASQPSPTPQADSQPAPANTRQIAECYGDCPTDPKTCANPCKFEGRAARTPADSVTAPHSEPWYGHQFKEVRRGYWQCSCGKAIAEAVPSASKDSYPPLPNRYAYDDDGGEMFTADHMRAYVDADRASHGQAPAGPDDAKDAARWRWLGEHIQAAWHEGKFTSLVRIVSDSNRAALNTSIDRMMAGDWSDADRAAPQQAAPQQSAPAVLSATQMRALKDARATAMHWAAQARTPECGEFGLIAQDLDWLVNELAAPQQAAPTDGWLQSGSLLYRLTDDRQPRNRDEIRVTMADGSHTPEACARRAGELLDRIRAAPQQEVQEPWGYARRMKSSGWGLCCKREYAEAATDGDDAVKLYAAQPAPSGDAWKDGDTAALVNELRDAAVQYRDTQQLRERIAHIVRPLAARVAPSGEAEDAARWRFAEASLTYAEFRDGDYVNTFGFTEEESKEALREAIDAARKEGK